MAKWGDGNEPEEDEEEKEADEEADEGDEEEEHRGGCDGGRRAPGQWGGTFPKGATDREVVR